MDQLLTGRADEGLAEFLRYENVAWYQDGAVRILDRRKYPTETTYVSCTSVEGSAGCDPRHGHTERRRQDCGLFRL